MAETGDADQNAEREAEDKSGELDEFSQFEVLVEKGLPSRVAIALVTMWRAGDEATREQMDRVCDEVWTWIDLQAEERHPPTRNGRRHERWRPFSPEALWRQITEEGA